MGKILKLKGNGRRALWVNGGDGGVEASKREGFYEGSAVALKVFDGCSEYHFLENFISGWILGFRV